MKTKTVANMILKELSDLEPYIYHEAYSTSSIYIKFKDDRLRSVTVRDHNTIEKYKYKWNIRLDKKKSFEYVDDGKRRFVYSVKDIKKFFTRIRQYKNTIDKNNIEKTTDHYDELYMKYNSIQ